MADPAGIGPLKQPETAARLPAAPARRWHWAWLGAGLALVAACGAVLSPFSEIEASVVNGRAAVRSGDASARDLPERAADGTRPIAGTPFVAVRDDGPEGRLMAAYAALSQDRGREAFERAAALVRDHPGFALAQLLYADLLSARAGWPAAFGVSAHAAADTADPRRQALRLEAQRRLAALVEPAPSDRVPAAFVRLSPVVRHAVAVDASRSRLYLFANGPDGLRLERNFYVSLGKQGVDKRIEGDRRTPLGIYWITAALPRETLEERFGHGALRFNYPNAADRLERRTGSGLFLHGVPSGTLNHEPWATDGCVAMSNADIEQLLRTLDISATPVLITERIEWITPEAARQAAAAFEPAWAAWSRDRRGTADGQAAASWYLPGAAAAPRWTPAPDDAATLSVIAWHSGGRPMMIVTAHTPQRSPGEPISHRQYWTQQDSQWRIAFEGPVAAPIDGTASAARLAVNAETGEPDETAMVVREEQRQQEQRQREARRPRTRGSAHADATTTGS